MRTDYEGVGDNVSKGLLGVSYKNLGKIGVVAEDWVKRAQMRVYFKRKASMVHGM